MSYCKQDYDLYVLELSSSFQLETTYSLKATAATILNISEDHMDRYFDLEDYRQAKLRIYENCQRAVINAEDVLTTTEDLKSPITFGESQADYWLKTENGKQYLMAKERLIYLVMK